MAKAFLYNKIPFLMRNSLGWLANRKVVLVLSQFFSESWNWLLKVSFSLSPSSRVKLYSSCPHQK